MDSDDVTIGVSLEEEHGLLEPADQTDPISDDEDARLRDERLETDAALQAIEEEMQLEEARRCQNDGDGFPTTEPITDEEVEEPDVHVQPPVQHVQSHIDAGRQEEEIDARRAIEVRRKMNTRQEGDDYLAHRQELLAERNLKSIDDVPSESEEEDDDDEPNYEELLTTDNADLLRQHWKRKREEAETANMKLRRLQRLFLQQGKYHSSAQKRHADTVAASQTKRVEWHRALKESVESISDLEKRLRETEERELVLIGEARGKAIREAKAKQLAITRRSRRFPYTIAERLSALRADLWAHCFDGDLKQLVKPAERNRYAFTTLLGKRQTGPTMQEGGYTTLNPFHQDKWHRQWREEHGLPPINSARQQVTDESNVGASGTSAISGEHHRAHDDERSSGTRVELDDEVVAGGHKRQWSEMLQEETGAQVVDAVELGESDMEIEEDLSSAAHQPAVRDESLDVLDMQAATSSLARIVDAEPPLGDIRTLRITNMPKDTTVSGVERLLQGHGRVDSAIHKKGKVTVVMDTSEEARDFIMQWKGKKMGNKPLDVFPIVGVMDDASAAASSVIGEEPSGEAQRDNIESYE